MPTWLILVWLTYSRRAWVSRAAGACHNCSARRYRLSALCPHYLLHTLLQGIHIMSALLHTLLQGIRIVSAICHFTRINVLFGEYEMSESCCTHGTNEPRIKGAKYKACQMNESQWVTSRAQSPQTVSCCTHEINWSRIKGANYKENQLSRITRIQGISPSMVPATDSRCGRAD